jgi:hypothetical protein
MTTIPLTIPLLDALDEFMDVVRNYIATNIDTVSGELSDAYWQTRQQIDAWRKLLPPVISEPEPINTIPLEEWQRRAYKHLCYGFMLSGTIEAWRWGGAWDVIERAPLEIVPPLPCEPNWRTLPYWVNWWAIDGDGTIQAFHLKPMGWVERRLWMLGAHAPVTEGLPIEMIAGYLGTKDEPQPVTDWYMTLRRRPAHLQPPEPDPEPVSKPAAKPKRKKKELAS